jgi:membrane protease YdiL (CAAX protease family)
MATVKAYIKGHPVLSYYALVFAISWGGILLVIGGPGAIPGTRDEVEMLMPFALLALFAGPSVAGLLLTGIVHGRPGFRDLFARMTRWRVDIRWYAVALLTAPLLVTAVLLALSLTSPEFLPRLLTASDKATLLLFGIGWGLVGGGLLEELGWTGFAVPTLMLRYGVFGTGLVVGLLWGAWHYLIALWAISSTTPGAISPSIFLPALIFYVGSLPAYRVLLVWVYDRTGGSMLLAMLMHASFSASMLTLEPLGLAAVPGSIWALVLAAAWWAVVGAVAVANHGRLSRRPVRRRVA